MPSVSPTPRSDTPPNSLVNTLGGRIRRLSELIGILGPIPESWVIDDKNPARKTRNSAETGRDLAPLPCSSWGQLIDAWRRAMRWRETLDDVFSVMLAVAISTEQVGDQLFLKVIGDAGSGKTRLCDGMLISKTCYPLEHLTGFHSGWKGGEENGKDYSLISRINRKTLITPEGDVLMSSPQFTQIMSQQRRIFDGTSGASYKNMEEDQRYTGLRTPWIIAGTPALLDHDQSRLGDRFLKVFMETPDLDEKIAILRRVGHTALQSVRMTSDGAPETQLTPEMCYAYQLTGGYVNWLKSNTALLSTVSVSDDNLDRCAILAQFTGYMRATEPKADHPTTELPTRLNHQFVRLACCLPVVLNRTGTDSEVMRRVKKVSLDTARGPTLTITHSLAKAKFGLEIKGIYLASHVSEDKCRSLMRFLRQIGVAETRDVLIPAKRASPIIVPRRLYAFWLFFNQFFATKR